jgi:hypothetical protein
VHLVGRPGPGGLGHRSQQRTLPGTYVAAKELTTLLSTPIPPRLQPLHAVDSVARDDRPSAECTNEQNVR